MAKYLDEDSLDELVDQIKTLVATKQDALTQGTGISITTSGGTATISVDADSSPTSGSSKPVTSGGVYTALGNKQDTLTFDTTPTSSSTNPVTSGGIYSALTGNGISSLTDKGLSENDYTDTEKTKLSGIASGAQVNVLESVKSGSTTFTITNKAVDIQSVDNLTNYYTTANTYNKTEIDAMVSAVYKPAGSVAFASLPTLSASVLGNVYNVTDAFTTTSDFVEGAGKSYPANTNVVVVNTGTNASPVYKFDVLSGFVDLSGYVPTSRTINNKALTSNITLTASDVGALPSTTTYVESVKSLDTTATTAQTTSASEAISGTGTITLHKVSKTGTYSDLISAPANETAASGGTTVSLVTTGEKYTWNSKQDAMTAITRSEVAALFA